LGVTLEVSTAQLVQIFSFAEKLLPHQLDTVFNLKFDGIYGNNTLGAHWSARKIIDYAEHPDLENDLLSTGDDGAQKNSAGSGGRPEFALRAAQELVSAENR